jgi:hypothetical protein
MRGPASMGMGQRGPSAGWGGAGARGGGMRGNDYGPGGEFPTAAEAANGECSFFSFGRDGSEGNGEADLVSSHSLFSPITNHTTAKNLRAQAIIEQMQSRDRAVQARAAAAAAANAHLLEGLDAFRGVHLDPNASHWDEVTPWPLQTRGSEAKADSRLFTGRRRRFPRRYDRVWRRNAVQDLRGRRASTLWRRPFSRRRAQGAAPL